MSNLLKSKFLIGVTIATVMLGASVALTQTALGATCTVTTTLRVGSKGADVKCLQSALNLTADGSFGPKTKAAVVAWQKSKGLTADGVFGAKSRAAWSGGTVSTTCTGVDPMTGLACSTTPPVTTGTLPAGCDAAQPTQMYSRTIVNTPCVVSGGTVVTVPSTGPVAVSLAADTPVAATHATGTAYNPVLKLNLVAGSQAATFNGLTLTRQGISLDSYIAGVAAFDANGNRLTTNFVTFADNKAVLTFTTPLAVAAGSTTPIWIKTNIAVGNTPGTYSLSVASAGDVSASGTVSGTFPISSPEFKLVDGANAISTLTVDAVQVYANGNNDVTPVNVNIGTTNQQIAKFRFAAGAQEDVQIKHILLYNSGNTNDADVANVSLVGPDGTILKTAQMVNRYVNFDLSAAPYKLLKGTTRDLSVQLDIVSGSTRNVRFVVQNDYDIEVSGVSSGNGILATKAGVVDNAFPIGDVSGGNNSCTTAIPCINKLTIAAGTALFAKSTDAPSGNIAAGASSIVLGKWDFTPQGEAMEMRQLTYSVSAVASLSGTVRLKINGSTVYSIAAANAAIVDTAVTLSSYPTLAVGVKANITVESDIKSTAVTGATISAKMDVTQVRRVSSNDIVDPTVAATTANVLTVNTASMSISKNSSYPNSTVVAGLSSAKVASFNLSAGSTEDVAVSSMTFNIDNVDGISNLVLMNGTTQLGSTVTSPATTNNVITMTGFSVPKGSTATVDVYVTTNTLAINTKTVSLTGVSATGKSSSVTVTASGLTSTGQLITFSAAGTLTLALDTTNTPVLGIAHSGESDRILLASRFTSSNAEDVKVTTVQLNLTNGQASLQNLKLFVNGAQVGVTTAVNGGTVASFTDTNGLFTVTKDSTVTLYVKGSTTTSSALNSQGVASVSLDYVEALGASGGSRIKPGTTLSTTWTLTTATVTGAALTVGNSTGFHAGDVVFVYDATNGGSLGIVSAEPTSTTSLTVAVATQIANNGGTASVSKIGSGASTAFTGGGGAVGVSTAYTVTTTKGFNVGDPVITVGATATRLGYVVSIGDAVTMNITSNGATTGANGYIAKLGTDTGIVATDTAVALATTATSTAVDSSSGFNIGDFVVAVDNTNAGTTCIVDAIADSTHLTLQCKAAVVSVVTKLIRVGQANPSTALVTTTASAGTRAVATAAATVVSTSGFGVGDVVVSEGTTNTGANLGIITVNTDTTHMSATASADAGTFVRITRLPGAASAGATITYEDVEPTITADSSVVGGSSTGQSGQVVGMYDVKADGDRNMNITAVNVQSNGNNLPWNYVTSYDLYNGSNLLSSATTLSGVAVTAGAANDLSGTTIKLCDDTVSTTAGGVRLSTGVAVAATKKISVGDKIVLFKDTTNYITATVTAKVVGAIAACNGGGGGEAADITLTVSNNSVVGAVAGDTVTAIKSYNVHFDTNAATPLATQTITAGSTLPLTVKADTTSVRTGLGAGVSASFSTKVNGTQGSSTGGGLTWGYTPSGGTAIAGLTASDSYPVNGPTFNY